MNLQTIINFFTVIRTPPSYILEALCFLCLKSLMGYLTCLRGKSVILLSFTNPTNFLVSKENDLNFF